MVIKEATYRQSINYRSRTFPATTCGIQAIWFRYILQEVQFKQEAPTTIYCDNGSTIKLSRDPVLHGSSKHISVRYYFLKDRTTSEELELVYCRSEDQVAYIFTKALKPAGFQKLRKMFGVCKIWVLTTLDDQFKGRNVE